MSVIKQPKRPVIHAFPRAYATTHGENEAIILKWLAHKTRKSKNLRDKKLWFYGTFSDISKQFPYLSRSSVARAIDSLANAKLIEIGNYNKRKFDRTKWYHVPQPHRDAVEKGLIRFDLDIASDYGILAGVLFQNLRHWIQLHSKQRRPLRQVMSAAYLSRKMPFFSESSIKRTLNMLQKKGQISRLDPFKPIYALPNYKG